MFLSALAVQAHYSLKICHPYRDSRLIRRKAKSVPHPQGLPPSPGHGKPGVNSSLHRKAGKAS
jgi:hypothetical protein